MMSNKIRLACEECNTHDGDGITKREAERQGWTHIEAIKGSQEESEWWDHLGYCPEHNPDPTPAGA
jgi:hypothetical protein